MRNPNLSSQWLTALVGVFYILAPPLRRWLYRNLSCTPILNGFLNGPAHDYPRSLGKILGFKLEVSVSSHASRRLPRNDP